MQSAKALDIAFFYAVAVCNITLIVADSGYKTSGIFEIVVKNTW